MQFFKQIVSLKKTFNINDIYYCEDVFQMRKDLFVKKTTPFLDQNQITSKQY